MDDGVRTVQFGCWPGCSQRCKILNSPTHLLLEDVKLSCTELLKVYLLHVWPELTKVPNEQGHTLIHLLLHVTFLPGKGPFDLKVT